jgi:Response regulator containing a CheY-like receiver domain and an HTH DNA-binding domain
MGAEAFAQRALIELDATGERGCKRNVETASDLIALEAQIARLVSDGCSNREVASQLFISGSTVEYHLGKVYRKLGVSSRTQLARGCRGHESGADLST